ncbi:hypothetical protein A3A71_00890 [Candidatus Berkelbacteria bacterium RIFCSPLOWO2_01_FULL_50_28]|uniref:Uncharacterized protein n=1 Tax=Candidatus Berkelbacteria bacterium RIFCSPLOWO2_01_FULL_50_28 TaxID=1797471 RepID=A0A1F5EB05_9BACT|nr:MAG: hypothetical protein A2807_01460 [Candidatus Berkelbacteria bacterium RIFCSPHIGHO2_01_FULL_50_36]OGD62106.1 MAG: hypothetical protein A3F39_03115 [Candidatus Berkelbacteria bacterium RIFCSPHIGHO2_12_FULL_50_11]OGD64597.1 MAG: hypothetical protein A3A71_00890 [Candidatus Berkelbacteria bacterium RIFCSPLOWO2_01_FULL_50_28]
MATIIANEQLTKTLEPLLEDVDAIYVDTHSSTGQIDEERISQAAELARRGKRVVLFGWFAEAEVGSKIAPCMTYQNAVYARLPLSIDQMRELGKG